METRTKSFSSIQQEVEQLIAELRKEPMQTVDLQPLCFRLTLNTTMAILFGRSIKDLERETNISEADFARSFDHAQHRLAQRGRLGDYFWLLGGRKFRGSCSMVQGFVDAIVAVALAERAEPTGNGSINSDRRDPDRSVFLQALISKTQDPTILRDQLINILLAGRDTTGCLLSWTL